MGLRNWLRAGVLLVLVSSSGPPQLMSTMIFSEWSNQKRSLQKDDGCESEVAKAGKAKPEASATRKRWHV